MFLNNKFRIMLSIILVFAFASISSGAQPSNDVQVRSYKISPIAFSCYQINSQSDKSLILFTTYGEKVAVAYPPAVENVIADTDAVLKECNAAWNRNVDQIISIQTSKNTVKQYLTFDGKVALMSKEDLLQVVLASEEKTVQKDPASNKVVAEFRSKVFQVNASTAFFIYATFVFSSDKSSVEQIIISAVKLES